MYDDPGSAESRVFDGDGYGAETYTTAACDQPSGYVEGAGDCDDGDASSFPYGEEVCDGADNDCDGTVDEGTGALWYPDTDGDGYGAPNLMTLSCNAPDTFYVENDLDCDDQRSSSSPNGVFRGVYHVLMGAISPLDGIGPEELNLKKLRNRIADSKIK